MRRGWRVTVTFRVLIIIVTVGDNGMVVMPCHSVPTSPAMARSSHKSQPVTPQRLPLQRTGHRYSSSTSFYRSPTSPSSPYTPLSLRSFTSSTSGASSALNTPDTDGTRSHLAFSPSVASPAVRAHKDHSLADIAENWRSRANENGIKVSSMNDDSHFGDDEASDRTASDTPNDSIFISPEEALLAPSLISNQRGPGFAVNRPRAQSHLPSPTTRSFASPSNTRTSVHHLAQPSSPLASRRLNQSQNVNVTSTPPPNRALARQLKLKGSLTDPAATRRREAFGPLWTPSKHNTNNMNQTFTLGLNQDTSLDLFDIDENDFENDFDYAHDQEIADDSLMEQHFHSKNNNNNTFDNNVNSIGYSNYNLPLPLLPSYGQQHQFFSHSQAPFSDPFNGNALGRITESLEHYFHTQQQFCDSNIFVPAQSEFPPHAQPWAVASKLPVSTSSIGSRNGYAGGPAWVPVPAPSNAVPKNILETAKPIVKAAESKKSLAHTSGCSVCLAPSPRTLAVLAPCGHPLCSACLTSALNIVGEKDMECAVCRAKVADFKLISSDGLKVDAPVSADERKTPDGDTGRSFMDPLFSSPESHGRVHRLESAFEFGLGIDNTRASTPKREERDFASREKTDLDGHNGKTVREHAGRKGKDDENVVLRIDNVPWDITPPQIHKWLQQPLERVHVLLDKRGKTMSHAYVEVADVAIAGRILRGEAQSELPHGKPRERGSVLGKGRRARGVTVTRSGQEELMADLFPNWRGSFDGSRPSLAGLNSDQVISALEGGLIGENEVVGLLHLIKEPDSHFLKAPILPFHSLMSILSKFPSDVDSRVFWSSTVRDTLYDITYAAVQILLSRVNSKIKSGDGNEYPMDLVSELINTALSCHAFTAQQLSKFAEFLEPSSPSPAACPSGHVPNLSAQSELQTPDDHEGRDCVFNTIEGKITLPPTPSSGSDIEDKVALAELAREFGVEAQLVQALAQRLAGLS
ncbi:hypothetical protein H2248_011462 [Termitomyces sp. 'cryptogamus']|nr:hypothetical protein H2248_011462 [Termitomyces sp. 'cryptogamus']